MHFFFDLKEECSFKIYSLKYSLIHLEKCNLDIGIKIQYYKTICVWMDLLY